MTKMTTDKKSWVDAIKDNDYAYLIREMDDYLSSYAVMYLYKSAVKAGCSEYEISLLLKGISAELKKIEGS